MNPAAIALTLVPSPEHTLTGHPENAGRFQHFDKLDQVPFSDRFVFIEPVIASQQAVTAIHPVTYLQALEQAAERGPGFVDYGDTYVTPHSYQAALEAAGGGTPRNVHTCHGFLSSKQHRHRRSACSIARLATHNDRRFRCPSRKWDARHFRARWQRALHLNPSVWDLPRDWYAERRRAG
jgi:hypothetical protein